MFLEKVHSVFSFGYDIINIIYICIYVYKNNHKNKDKDCFPVLWYVYMHMSFNNSIT